MPSTYTPIATTTLGSGATSVTFSSISSAYTDLVLVASVRSDRSANNSFICSRLNSDNSTTHSYTTLTGDGTTPSSGRETSIVYDSLVGIAAASQASGTFSTVLYNVQNYANTTTYKTLLVRGNDAGTSVRAQVGLWRSTSAVGSIYLYDYYGNNLVAGSTFTLYGVKSA